MSSFSLVSLGLPLLLTAETKFTGIGLNPARSTGLHSGSPNPPNMWQKEPFKIELQAGKTAAICRCGQTSVPPMCDGTHKGTEFSPELLRYDKDKTLWICGCGKSAASPFCDGTHKYQR